MDQFLNKANELFDYTQNLRRDLHMHPELGFQEVRTASIVANELRELGLDISTGIAKTGVIAILDSGKPGPIALLRFDMDALPIQEETGASYASQNSGVMHACGHDGHIAVGLTVARILNAYRDHLSGTIKFVFQPAEEGLGGAAMMVAEGVLENPRPNFCLTMHVWNDKPFGWLGISPGPIMAASETFHVLLTGKGGHGASPNLTIDPVLACAQIITALQSIVARNVPPLKTAVVSVTSVHSGEAFNVIPSQAEFKGTIRTFDPEVRSHVLNRFNEIVYGVANAMGCNVEIKTKSITPAVTNDAKITNLVQEIAKKLLPDFDIENNATTMGSEDMAYMMQEIPGCYIFVGSANAEKSLDAPHHNPRFDFDERAMLNGAALMAKATVDILKGLA